jgi:hypothetical protein
MYYQWRAVSAAGAALTFGALFVFFAFPAYSGSSTSADNSIITTLAAIGGIVTTLTSATIAIASFTQMRNTAKLEEKKLNKLVEDSLWQQFQALNAALVGENKRLKEDIDQLEESLKECEARWSKQKFK